MPGVLFLKNHRYHRQKEASYNSQSDEELLSAFRKSENNELIGILFDRYIHLVFASCMKYLKNEDDAQDSAMEIFETLPDKLLKHKIVFFKSWLYVTSRNHCLMLIRKKKATEKLENIENTSMVSVESDCDLHHINEDIEENEIVLKYLSELKDGQKICVELMYLKGMSYKDIACKTGFELKHVKSYIQNGKRKLKLKLEQYYEGQTRT